MANWDLSALGGCFRMEILTDHYCRIAVLVKDVFLIS